MSREEFQHLRQEHSRITLGKSLKYIGQLEFMSRLLSPSRRTGASSALPATSPSHADTLGCVQRFVHQIAKQPCQQFCSLYQKKRYATAVFFVPQFPGSGGRNNGIRTTSAGTFHSSLHQGVRAVGVRAYLLGKNLIVPALGLAAGRHSFDVNLDAAVNKNALPLPVLLGESPESEFAAVPIHADLVAYFGTASCWDVRIREFKRMLRFSVDKGILPAAAVRRSRKRLWPADLAREMEKRQLLEPASVLRLNRGVAASFAAGDPIPSEDLSLLVRCLMLAVNADLRRDPLDRRSAPVFDRDWTLLTTALTHLGYSVTPTPSVAVCSSGESYRRGAEATHERAVARSFSRAAGRGFKAAFQGSPLE